MKRVQWKQILAMGLALCLLAAVLFSVFFLVAETHHHCTGDNCPVCEEIKIVGSFLNGLKAALLAAAVFAALRLGAQRAAVLWERQENVRLSPVDLQVKLLN